MNYEKIYNQIVERAKNRVLDCYTESHHIIPRCMGGSDEKENLVNLTAREHFIAHKLLCEIYSDNEKLFYAHWAMTNQRNRGRNYKVSSREYQRLREEFKKKMSAPKSEETKRKISKALTGKIHSQDHKRKMSQSLKGREPWNKGVAHTKEARDKMSNSSKGRKAWNKGVAHTEETKRKISTGNTGKKLSEETKEKMRQSRLRYLESLKQQK